MRISIASLLLSMLFFATASAQEARTSFKLTDNSLELPSPVSFTAGTAALTRESNAALEHIKAYLDEKTYISLLRIEGHVAGDGSQKLSEQRAMAVANWLVSHGVDCKRIIAVGFGNNKPIADDASATERNANTRITVVNAALRGHAIGGMPLDGGGQVAGDACQ